MKTFDIEKIRQVYEERKRKSFIQLRPIEEMMMRVIKKNPSADVISCMDYIHKNINCTEKYYGAMPEDAPQSIQDWISSKDRRGLYMHGEVGTGKTHILYALAKLYRANGKDVDVKNFPNWLDDLRQSYKKENDDVNLGNELNKNCILMIDDIGSEKASEWTLEIMYRLINNRYENAMPTIFAGNLDISQFSKKYGDRITSRIVEMVGGKCGIIKISGEDRRLKL